MLLLIPEAALKLLTSDTRSLRWMLRPHTLVWRRLRKLISEAFAGYLQSCVLSYGTSRAAVQVALHAALHSQLCTACRAASRAAVQVALHAALHSLQSCILSSCAGSSEQLCRYLCL